MGLRLFQPSMRCAHDAARESVASRHPTRGELAADCAIHVMGVAGGSVGGATLVALIAVRGDWLELGALLIYALGMVAMFCCSAAYNLARSSPWRTTLRRCDHAAIFVMIAGTYTPFTLITLRGPWGWSLFAIVWALAAIGMYLVVRGVERRAPVIALYVGLGWIGLVAIGPLVRNLPAGGLWLLFGGGVCYTLGVPFYLSRRLPYSHALWHAFVLAGSTLQFFAVLWYVLPAPLR